ncbi:MAG TPA: hypothetical protein VN602_00970 [Gemmatimonadaceae bacterium]|nr:hypothetical protein [Gemmatimonadaceae bacterium]
MRRLVTLLLCLFTATGARSSFAAVGQNASTHENTSVFAIGLSATDSSHDAPAADPAWAAPAPVVLAPVTRGVAPHAVRQHGTAFAALALTVPEQQTGRGQSAAAHHARIQPARRGYRATGPPQHLDMSPFTNSLARPA